jgi:peptide/nickel transport system permease protein
MKGYVLRRALETIPVIIGVIILSFSLLHLAPGDPVYLLAGESATASDLEVVRRQFGLDKPLYEQLLIYLTNTFQGNLGFSYVFGRPVSSIIIERVPLTILLVATGLTISVVFGVIAGVASARKPYSLTDMTIMGWGLVGYSIPVFWLAQLFILFFSIDLNLFPSSGVVSVRATSGLPIIQDILWHLVLPALTLSMAQFAVFARLTRASLLEVLREKYIITARAKGIKERQVFYKHALRNSILPVVTYGGIYFGLMIGGVILTETVFAWPGLGRLLFDSIYLRDYPVVMGMFIFLTISVVIAQLATDILYAFLDPRISYA